jgi:nicotinate-nucleotide adenylyltransferase
MPVWYLVPDGVVQYIEKRGLYREGHRRPSTDSGRTASDAADGRPPGDRPTYDRPPAEGTGPASTDDPDPQPPITHLQEVPR